MFSQRGTREFPLFAPCTILPSQLRALKITCAIPLPGDRTTVFSQHNRQSVSASVATHPAHRHKGRTSGSFNMGETSPAIPPISGCNFAPVAGVYRRDCPHTRGGPFTARFPLQTFTPSVSAFHFPIFGFSLRQIKTRHPFRMPRFTVKTHLTCGLSMLPRREALCLRGIRAKHRRRWRCGSSCRQDRISSLRKQSRRRR